ncbi:MAG: CDP-glycerol glycerophosphotransferase family protein, partial [Candidatus Cloacimonetes bacterium]|nr:CDP-glycerol glycerophosphotransferase family protein [Candidatus Cloacimonadota bacterium]
DYDRQRSGANCTPALEIGNGVTVEQIPVRTAPYFDGQTLNLLMIASFDNWHGVDRIIRGMMNSDKQVMLYLCGRGNLYDSLRQLVQKRGLQHKVRFAGWLEGDSLNRMFNRCHLALGSLALHRIPLKQAAVLKVRQYLARGIPVVIGYEDVDLPAELPYILQVEASEEPIDINELFRFTSQVYSRSELIKEIRDFTKEHLDWSVKTRKLSKFLKALPAKGIKPKQRISDKKRILFVCHDFPPHRFAGAQLYARNLAQKINEEGLAEVEVLYPVMRQPHYPLYSVKTINRYGLVLHELSKPKVGEPQKIRDSQVENAVLNFLRNHTYDAIHLHGLGQITLAPILAAKALNLPVIMTLHDYWFLCDRWHMIRKDQSICSGPESLEKCADCYIEDNHLALKPAIKQQAMVYKQVREREFAQAFEMLYKVFAPSRYLSNIFAKFNFNGIEVIPLGFDYENIEPSARIDADSIHFGFTGQMISRKGLNFLVEAFSRLEGNNIFLHIWGKPNPGDYTASIMKQSKADKRIIFHGGYVPEQLPEIYRGFDIAVVPSLMENYPLVVQEAFIHKTPVIATNVGGIPEVLINGKNGLMVEPGFAESLCEAMRKIIRQPELLKTFTANIKPVRRLKEDATQYNAVYEELTNKTKISSDRLNTKPDEEQKRVLEDTVKPSEVTNQAENKKYTVQFYVAKNVHWAMFEELYHYLSKRPEIEDIVICIPNLSAVVPVSNHRETIEKIMALPVTHVCNPRAISVDVTFIADAIAGKVKGAGKIVNIGHGTISKGFYYMESVWTERQNWVDLLCVPGSYALNVLQNILSTEVVATGMSKLDPVFAGNIDTDKFRTKLGLDPARKIVLYAPTFNIDLSSIYNFSERFDELASKDYYILIKLHGSTPGGFASRYEDIAHQVSSFRFIEDSNLAPWLALADVMISDVSSAWMEFMALDKPVILYTNPVAQHYHGYDTENIEWAWRELGTEVRSFDELKAILPGIVRFGDDKSSKRLHYANQLFTDRTGKASENVWKATIETIKNSGSNQPGIISLVIECSYENLYIVRSNCHWLEMYSVMPLELIFITDKGNQIVDDWIDELRITSEFINVKVLPKAEHTQGKAIENASGEIVIWLDDDTQLFKNYDYMLYKTFEANQDISVLTAVTDQNSRGANYQAFDSIKSDTNLSRFAYEFIYHYKGSETGQCSCPNPALLAVQTKRLSVQHRLYPFRLVRELSSKNQLPVALSVFFTFQEQELREIRDRLWKNKSIIPAIERYELGLQLLEMDINPDIAEIVFDASIELGRNEKHGLITSSMLFTRFNDIKLRHKIESAFPAGSNLRKFLSRDREILEKLRTGIPQNPANIPEVTDESIQKRVLLYFYKNVHIPILTPIYRELKKHSQLKIQFAIMPPRADIRAGFTDAETRVITALGAPICHDPCQFNPDVTIIADSFYWLLEGLGKIVHVGHGVLSKGQYYTDTKLARREENADLVCVPGEYHKKKLNRIIETPVLATGMAKLDDAFTGRVTRQTVLNHYGLPADKKYILFSPTFNDELSMLPFMQKNLPEIIPDSNTLVIVKLHGSTDTKYKEIYRNLVKHDQRIIFADDDELDITPFLVLCDVLVSDVSSTVMEFAALDKPVVLFNNPDCKKYKHYNPADIDFAWRDIGIQVQTLEEMKNAVARCFDRPEEFKKVRKTYTDQLFANKQKGNATEKIVQAVLHLAMQNTDALVSNDTQWQSDESSPAQRV